MDLSVAVQVEDVNARAAFGRSAGLLEDHEVTVTVTGLIEGVTARIPAPTPATGLTYTGDCKDGCVVTPGQPSAVIGVINNATEEQAVTFGANPVGGRETNPQDNRATLVFKPRDVTPLPARVNFGVMAGEPRPTGNSGKHSVTVTVTGLQEGQAARLTARPSMGAILSSADCGSGINGVVGIPRSCVVTPADTVLTFKVSVPLGGKQSVTFSVTPVKPMGAKDTDPTNDSDTVVIPARYGGGHGDGGPLETVAGTVNGVLNRQ